MSKEHFNMLLVAREQSSISTGSALEQQTPITVVGHAIGAKWPEAEKMVASLTRFEGISKTTSVNKQVAHETEAFYYSKIQKVNPVLARRGGRTN